MPIPTLLPEEQEAEQFLKALDLTVLPVPRSTSETPEFIVDGDARGYVVEVKAREDSEKWTGEMESGQVALQQRSMGCGPWAEKVARKAVKQFRSVDAQHLRWWVLWLAIKCVASPDAMGVEAIGTLFGARTVVYCDDAHSKENLSKWCLFARRGVFELHPEIVASVVNSGDGLCLCGNDQFSEDFNSFQQSVLWSHLSRIHPPTTATGLTERGGCFRADLSVDRSDDSALQAYLERAYRLKKAIIVNGEAHSASHRADSTEG
jgi:hypothetical protein